MNIKFSGIDESLKKGIEEISNQLSIIIASDGIEINVKQSNSGLKVCFDGNKGEISYSKKSEFFRGLSLLVQNLKTKKKFEIKEVAKFSELGAQYDNSRNGVMTEETVKKAVRILALMGYTQLYLYTEDTYEIQEYPQFGYFRGKYTIDELRRCVEYAEMFGIEMVPCVQTLAHLKTAMRWDDFREITDCNDILLIDDKRTYDFIEASIKSLRSMYKSKNINIGMDEADMVGLGKYLKLHGYTNTYDLMMRHLKRVIDICKKYDFKPQMWSDMFFKLMNMDYYDDALINKELIDKVPKEVTLCYWDYYQTNKSIYDKNIEKHQQFNNEVSFAGGAWKWIGPAPANHFSLTASRLALESCVEHGIQNVMVTGWSDNGSECANFSTLPTMQLYAEYCYSDDVSDSSVAKRLKVCAKANFDDFLNLDLANLPNLDADISFPTNPSKYLLYQDVLMGLFDTHMEIGTYNKKFSDNAELMKKAKKRNPEWKYIFDQNKALNEFLSKKCDIGLIIKKAYDEKDREALKNIADVELVNLRSLAVKLHKAMRNQWYSENKTFGFDVIDIRFGALKERINSAILRINQYLDGEVSKLDELEEERQKFSSIKIKNSDHICFNLWTETVTPNTI